MGHMLLNCNIISWIEEWRRCTFELIFEVYTQNQTKPKKVSILSSSCLNFLNLGSYDIGVLAVNLIGCGQASEHTCVKLSRLKEVGRFTWMQAIASCRLSPEQSTKDKANWTLAVIILLLRLHTSKALGPTAMMACALEPWTKLSSFFFKFPLSEYFITAKQK